MDNGCCSNCQAKATKKKKNSKEVEADEETMKQDEKVSEEKENPKTDSKEGNGSNETSDKKDNKKKKKKSILTWQHSSTKKEKASGKNLVSEKSVVNQPDETARLMMHQGGPNPSNRWPISAPPRGHYPPFPMAPMYGPYGGGCCGPIQSMPPPMFPGVQISPYPPMAAVAPHHYWQTRAPMDTNPMKRYTTYADNYSYCFI